MLSSSTSTAVGCVDSFTTRGVDGWAYDPTQEHPLIIRILVDGIDVEQTCCRNRREDLLESHHDRIKAGFHFALPSRFFDDRQHVMRLLTLEGDALVLRNHAGDSTECWPFRYPSYYVAGHIETLSSRKLTGWVLAVEGTSDRARLVDGVRVFEDGKEIAFARLGVERPDVAEVYDCGTACGFSLDLPSGLNGKRLTILTVPDYGELPNSPVIVPQDDPAVTEPMPDAIPSQQAEPEINDRDVIEVLRVSGLFDDQWYRHTYTDLRDIVDPPIVHYFYHGEAEGRQPNPYFVPAWYRTTYAEQGIGASALAHYIETGEAIGNHPAPFFNSVWYRQANNCKTSPLKHFLERRNGGHVSPVPEFDADFYLSKYRDVAAAGIDPFEHYLFSGFRENRNPSAGFDTKYYIRRHLDGVIGENPLLHFLSHRHEATLDTLPPESRTTIPREVKFFTQPGPHFEHPIKLSKDTRRLALVLAYYLPQFYTFAENDRWWGNGFTEWTNLARALPRFAGHYQPRIPRDLGYYSLTSAEVLRQQVELANNAGIGGFIFYFYWFNGKRLLDRPLNAFLADKTIKTKFCLMWANENWTRRWDGLDQEVLISQEYRTEDDDSLLDTFASYFADARYIRIDGRPLLMLYRPGIIPDAQTTIARWRRRFQERTGENPIWIMAQGFGDIDPRDYELDGAIEFPPHKIAADLPNINGEVFALDDEMAAPIVRYDDVVKASLDEADPPFPLIKTAFPSWDNDPRRQGAGMIFHGSTPAKYQAWLAGLIAHSRKHPFMGESIVCLNAWNEWAEGAYLEPDVHFGSAYLNATARAVSDMPRAAELGKLILVGHDAHRHGAQYLLLNIARRLQANHGIEVETLLLDSGPLVPDYAEVASTTVIREPRIFREKLAELTSRGFKKAIVNSAASSSSSKALAERDVEITLLVHEMPSIIEEMKLMPAIRRAVAVVKTIVFAAPAIGDGFTRLFGQLSAATAILPQGSYKDVTFSAAGRDELRAELGIPTDAVVVLCVGYADLRKGFDWFLQAWRLAQELDVRVHFLWVGGMSPILSNYYGAQMAKAAAAGTFHYIDHRERLDDVYSAADIFALTSREDPFPTVVLEAMFTGTPTVAFEEAGGIPDMLKQLSVGLAVEFADIEAMVAAIATLAKAQAGGEQLVDRARIQRIAEDHFRFDDYLARLFSLVRPDWKRVSVVVPNYNYARYLPGRLASIFNQTYPVYEIIVLDDASTDDSIAVLDGIVAQSGRKITIIANETNSGSVFRQWHKAAEAARGDYLWIAEADDEAQPTFIEKLMDRLLETPDACMAFTDSGSVDENDVRLSESYKPYYAAAGIHELERDQTFEAPDFLARFLSQRNLVLNVSSVIWRREQLVSTFGRIWDDLTVYRVAGDWLIYVDLMSHTTEPVIYVAEPLNFHRRHGNSVTHKLEAAAHIDEVRRVQAVVRRNVPLTQSQTERRAAYLRELAHHFELVAGD